MPMEPVATDDPVGRWHEVFVQAARDWLGSIDDDERLLLGLRWRVPDEPARSRQALRAE